MRLTDQSELSMRLTDQSELSMRLTDHSQVTSSGDERTESVSRVLRAGSGSSGDEEVSGLMGGSTTCTPVQFCTSPPLDVYKPRKSQSPPPKLFHMSSNGHGGQTGGGQPFRQHSFDSNRSREGQRPSGAFLPRPRPRLLRPVEFTSAVQGRAGGGAATLATLAAEEGEEAGQGEEPGTRSPNKRHRATPKPQNIQRPCLDFEKMQQVLALLMSGSTI